ncbi:hypothetical protein FEM48_Zijuj05G0028200 [Ziziphus jujuba var. spinosa]|uniref:BZIP domain-containing protein n=1 Tax=Ziziphus jujuba var. spinosa TaxID=714518 RepID=A0A978VCD8_ZIZJJ|nr:hypothetical protein FEM48_Zijuj05G0028200 [Ziziphus jujuba var. spinosa]
MNGNMDDGEVETSENAILQIPTSSRNLQDSTSVDSFIDDILKNTRTCTHTHTCNPPGPDSTHTHTCYHTHTQVLASEDDDHTLNKENSGSKPRKPSGNREAVRKYREKKKAHTAYLEEEVKKLRLLNQQLVRKLQGQAVLEAEVLRLRSLLVDLRGKIDNELGFFPYQKQCNGTTLFKDGDCGLQSTSEVIGQRCQTNLPCLHPHLGSTLQANINESEKTTASWKGNCQPALIDCGVDRNEMPCAEGQAMDMVETLVSSATQTE